MLKFIQKFKTIFYLETLGHLVFEKFDRFHAYNSSVFEKIESKNLLKREFCK